MALSFRPAEVILTLSILLLCLLGQARSQTATLRGKITDSESGLPLAAANVIVTSSRVQTGTASLSNGHFILADLPAGIYHMNVSYIGYARATVRQIRLVQGDARTVNVALTAAGLVLNPVSISASRRPEKSLDAPASVSTLEPRRIMQDVTPSPAATLRNVVAVDMATTGIDRREMVLRGFGNAFSGATYVLTDYRRAADPSLDVNLHAIMPAIPTDLERIEIVRGPGSALYGAGVAAGVIHYLTKDPFSYPGTALSFSGGERDMFAGTLRHARLISSRAGYKLTAQFAQATDWSLDRTDSLDAVQLATDSRGLSRDPDYQKFNINGLLEVRWSDRKRLSANAGFSTLDAALLSAIGTVQAKNFGYAYGQLRLQLGNFFAQSYINKNDAGESFVYGTGDRVVDQSTLFNAQAQYDLDIDQGQHHVTFGVDYDRTTPVTEGTIFGRNERDDLISEFGLYAQTSSQLSQTLTLTTALRSDYNNVEKSFQWSPRAALVIRPGTQHRFRVTYNRAYDLPAANSLFLDIVAGQIPLTNGFAITQRGRGAVRGFTFSQSRRADGFVVSGLLPTNAFFGANVVFPQVGVPAANVPLNEVYRLLYDGLLALSTSEIQSALATNGIDLSQAAIDFFVPALSPDNVMVQGLGTSILRQAPEEIKPLKSTVTQTLEGGYKGLLGDSFLLAVDAYYARKRNFISGVTQVTPLAVFNNITAELTPALAAGITDNATLATLSRLAGLTPEQVAEAIVSFAGNDLEMLPVAVVQPDDNRVPGEVVGAFRNFGDVDFWGIDLSLQVLATERLNLFGNLSFVSDDLFDSNELQEGDTALEVALNASKFKWKAGMSYKIPQRVSFNTAVRFTKGFPVRSGIFNGSVASYFLLDLGGSYDFARFMQGLRLDFTVQNLLNNVHREFVGAPRIGRLALARLTYDLP